MSPGSSESAGDPDSSEGLGLCPGTPTAQLHSADFQPRLPPPALPPPQLNEDGTGDLELNWGSSTGRGCTRKCPLSIPASRCSPCVRACELLGNRAFAAYQSRGLIRPSQLQDPAVCSSVFSPRANEGYSVSPLTSPSRIHLLFLALLSQERREGPEVCV